MWCDLYTLEFLMTPRHECRIKDLSRCSPTFTLDIPWAMIYVSNGAPTSLYVKSKFHPRGEARRCCWHGNPVYIAELLPKLVHDTTGVNYMTTSMKLTISAVLYPPAVFLHDRFMYIQKASLNQYVRCAKSGPFRAIFHITLQSRMLPPELPIRAQPIQIQKWCGISRCDITGNKIKLDCICKIIIFLI